ncbi:MAG: STAS domain-containing protein [Micromonosporaceae bacterium]
MSGPAQRPASRPSLVEVTLTEEIHAQGAARVHALLDDALARQPDRLVVDVADCPFVDAATLAVLLDAHRRAWRAGARLTLHRPSPRLYRILQLARVDHVFHITPPPPPQPPGRPARTSPGADRSGEP